MEELSLELKIEGVLFYKATPMKKSALCKLFEVTDEELSAACKALSERLTSGATRLLEADAEVQLVSAPALDDTIEDIRKVEMKRDIGKAGAETLAIVLYKGPISRVEIDRIRGVNSSFILRNLMVRGLVQRDTNGPLHTFAVTPTLLAHLGVINKLELPDHAAVLDQLEQFEKELEASENT